MNANKNPRVSACIRGCIGSTAIIIGLWVDGSPGIAQTVLGTIIGTVADTTGAVLPGVTVTITNLQTNVSTTAVTNESGDYNVPQLVPGKYSVSAELSGFKKKTQTGITVQVQQKIRIDLKLEVGDLSENVTVLADAPIITTDSSERGEVIDDKKVQDLPLLDRNFLELALLVSGATQSAFSDRPGNSININGGRQDANNILVDGVDNNRFFSNGESIQPSVTSVKEFKIQTNNYSAESGRSGGAVVNVALKNGTNQFHGELFEFNRNDRFNARPYFGARDPQDSTKTRKPPIRRNQFGGNLGGPILRNRTFFFVDYEGLRRRDPLSSEQFVPNAFERNGNFSARLGAQLRDAQGRPLFDCLDRPILRNQIYDPTTARPCPDGSGLVRDPFSNNTIPAERINPVARRLIDLYPLPNLGGLFFNFGSDQARVDQYDVRIDHNVSDRNKFFGRFSYRRQEGHGFPRLPGIAGAAQNNLVNNRNLAINDTHAFSGRLVNEFRFGYNRNRSFGFPTGFGEVSATDFGIPGIPPKQGIPRFQITDYSSIGPGTAAYNFNTENTFQWVDNITYTWRKHAFKAGIDFRRLQAAGFNPGDPFGNFVFNGIFTRLRPEISGTGLGLADFFLGMTNTVTINSQINPLYVRMSAFYFYFQDDLKISRKLTLNLGLRYELNTVPVDKFDQQANFNLKTGKLDLAGRDGNTRELINGDHNNWAPRFGFAYKPFGDNRTVVRGGYGVSYALIGGGTFRFLGQNPPNLVSLRFETLDNVTPGLGLGDAIPTGDRSGRGNDVRAQGPNFRTPYTQQWNLTIERELSRNLMVSIAYVGSKGTKLQRGLRNLNQLHAEQLPLLEQTPPAQRTALVLSLRPYPDFPRVFAVETAANSIYHSLQVTGKKRYSQGLDFLASYTLAKSIDDSASAVGTFCGGSCQPMDAFNFKRERGPSIFDRRHRFVISYGYELPWGSGRKWLHDGWASKVTGNWKINGITTLQSSLPFDIREQTSPITAAGFAFNRSDVVGPLELPGSQRTLLRYFNTSAAVAPAPFALGSAGRHILRGPGFTNFDASLFRDFLVKETHKIQIRFEAFNLMNTPRFAYSLFSDVQTRGSSGYGRILAAYPMRQIQFAIKYTF